ncbi:MAG: iron ABC transporter permease [Spongiibacteraceae bacterium]
MKIKIHAISDLQLLPSLAALLCAVLIFALTQGPVALDWHAALTTPDSLHGVILWQVRLPRELLAIAVGATLGLAGAALQGLLRNPLAGPDLVGVTSCAALGAVLTLYSGLAAISWVSLPLGGLIGAGFAVAIIFLLSGQRAGVLTLILAGMAINAMVSSLIALALNFSKNPFAMSEIVYWLLGSVANRSYNDLSVTLPFMLAGWLLLLSSGRFLDALSLGEETAQSLGFDVNALRWRVVLGVALSVGAAVSVSGNIGFVGLVVPHLLRPWVGYEPRRLLAASALGGALLLLIADVVVISVPALREIKIGVITALIGGPFFLHLIYKNRNAFS